MSINHQESLQEQVNKLDIQVAQLGGLIKALLGSSKDFSIRLEDLEDLIFDNSNCISEIKKRIGSHSSKVNETKQSNHQE